MCDSSLLFNFFSPLSALLFPLIACNTHILRRWLDGCTQKGNTSTRHFTHLIRFIHVDWLSVSARMRACDSRLKHFTLDILLLVGNRGGGGSDGGGSGRNVYVCVSLFVLLLPFAMMRWAMNRVECVYAMCTENFHSINRDNESIKFHKRICSI